MRRKGQLNLAPFTCCCFFLQVESPIFALPGGRRYGGRAEFIFLLIFPDTCKSIPRNTKIIREDSPMIAVQGMAGA